MANKKIDQLTTKIPALSDLMLIGDPVTGYSYKTTIQDIATIVASSTSLDALSDVVITSPTPNQVLQYNGTNWVNVTLGATGGSGTTNYIAKWTSSTILGDSGIEDTGTILQTKYLTNNIGLNFNYVSKTYQFKDDNGNGLELFSSLSNSTIVLGDYVNGYGLYLDTANGITKLGDYNGLYNSQYHTIDPTSSEMYSTIGSPFVGYYFNSITGLLAYGDYGNNLNYWYADTGSAHLGTIADGFQAGLRIVSLSKTITLGDWGNSVGLNTTYTIDWTGNPLHTWNLGNNGRMRILSGAGQRSGYIQSAFGNFLFGNNIYYEQPNWKYDGNGYGVYIQTEAQVAGSISFLTAPLNSSGAGVIATPVGRMTIFNDGNVVINKFVTSTYRLDIGATNNGLRVTGSGTSSATIGLRVENSSNVAGFVVQDDGFVGINTATPQRRFHVIASASLVPSVRLGGPTSDNGFAGYIEFVSNNTTSVNYQLYATTSGMVQSTTGTQGIFNFGYSASSGVAATISGKILASASGFFIRSESGLDLNLGTNNANNKLIIKGTTSNVLIGTTTDNGYRLAVTGTGYFSNNIFGATNLGLGTTTIDASAQLQMDSTTKGLLIPRLTDAQILAIVAPQNGLMVYSITQNHIAYYDATAGNWKKVNNSNL